jgi:acetyl esterase/lipase
MSDYAVTRDVVYGVGGGEPLRLDIYQPAARPRARMPAMVYVHGGGWRTGDKNNKDERLGPFASRGYFCVSVGYRLSHQAKFPAQINDVKCATRFLRAHADEYGIDPDRFGAWGNSAGGHLVSLLGTSAGVPELEGNGGWPGESSAVHAVCSWYSPPDLYALAEFYGLDTPDSSVTQLLGVTARKDPEAARRASPSTYVSPRSPAFLLIAGDADALIPLPPIRAFHERLLAAGVESTLTVYAGAGHGSEAAYDHLPETMRFFDRHLL